MKSGSSPASLEEKVLHQKEGLYQKKDPGKGRSNIRQGKLEDDGTGKSPDGNCAASVGSKQPDTDGSKKEGELQRNISKKQKKLTK